MSPRPFLFKSWWGPAHGGTHIKRVYQMPANEHGDNSSPPAHPKMPDSSEIKTAQQARKYWMANYANKKHQVNVHSGDRVTPISVLFPADNDHAYSEDTGQAYQKTGVRLFDPERASAMSRILDVISRPKVRLANYYADLMLEKRVAGKHYTVVLSWNDTAKHYIFKSAHFKSAQEVARLMRQKDSRKNKGPLQKGGPFPDFAGLHDARRRRSVSGGYHPCGPVSVCTDQIISESHHPSRDNPMSPIPLLFLKSLVPAHTRRLKSGKVVRVRQYSNKVNKHPDGDDQTLDMFADDPVAEPRQDLIAEHKRLVDVLNSPSHADDKAEAKKQAEELKEYVGASKPAQARIINPLTVNIFNPPAHGDIVRFPNDGERTRDWAVRNEMHGWSLYRGSNRHPTIYNIPAMVDFIRAIDGAAGGGGDKPEPAKPAHDPAKLREQMELLLDMLQAAPDSANAPVWRQKVAELKDALGPDAPRPEAKAESKPVDMTGWSEPKKAAVALHQEYQSLDHLDKKAVGALADKAHPGAKVGPFAIAGGRPAPKVVSVKGTTPDETELASTWSRLQERDRQRFLLAAHPSMGTLNGKPNAKAMKFAQGDWSAIPSEVKAGLGKYMQMASSDIRFKDRQQEQARLEHEKVEQAANARRAESKAAPDYSPHAKEQVIGGIRFQAVLTDRPRRHWRLKNMDTGKVFPSGAGGVTADSKPNLWAKLVEVLNDYKKHSSEDDFRKRFQQGGE